jgi:hypothetical protein
MPLLSVNAVRAQTQQPLVGGLSEPSDEVGRATPECGSVSSLGMRKPMRRIPLERLGAGLSHPPGHAGPVWIFPGFG